MAYRIVGDSCLDLTGDLRERKNVSIVSLSLTVDGYTIVDDETFDQSVAGRFYGCLWDG